MSTEKAKIIRISREIVFLSLKDGVFFDFVSGYIALTGYLPKALVIALMILMAPILPLIWTLQDMIEINMNKKLFMNIFGF